MSGIGKGRAIVDLAAELGTGVALTGTAGENSGDADLFAALDADLAGVGGALRPPVRRGPGRPVGALDRSTVQIRRFVAAKGYRDPLEMLAALASADPRQLAADLAGKPLEDVTFDEASEALKHIRGAADAALPYLHRKQPLDVHHVGTVARPLIVITDGAIGGVGQRGSDGALSVHDVVEYQPLSQGAADRSHGDGRTDGE